MKMGKRINSGSDIELCHITHDMVIADFLRKVAVAKDKKETSIDPVSLDIMENTIDYLEGFDLEILLDEKGETHTKIIFRGKEFEINDERFQELLDKYRENPYEGRTTN